MATRIESKHRPPKRVMGTLTWSTGGSSFTGTGRIPRLDQRGFPSKNGADTTRVTYTEVA